MNEDAHSEFATLIWQTGQRRLLNISSNSKWIVAASSGHVIIDDESQLVVDVFREVLTLVSQ